jgi:hypothetical protein
MLRAFVFWTLVVLYVAFGPMPAQSAETDWTQHVYSESVSNPDMLGTYTPAGFAVVSGFRAAAEYADLNSSDANAGNLTLSLAAGGKSIGGGLSYVKSLSPAITTSSLRGGLGINLFSGKLAIGGATTLTLGGVTSLGSWEVGGAFNPEGPFRIGATNNFAGVSYTLGKLITPFFDYGYVGSILKFGATFHWARFALTPAYQQSAAARSLAMTTYIGILKSGGLVASGSYDLTSRVLGYSGALAFRF